jgi:cell division protein FtsQ
LQQQRRQHLLRNIWRLLVLTALSAGLGYALLRWGWLLSGPEQVEVLGSRQVSREQVIAAAELSFPTPLLGLQPRRIAAELAAALPVEQVQVSRLMAPPRLRVALVDREPVARAQRAQASGIEAGYVDRLGNWMGSQQNPRPAVSSGPLRLEVIGWQPRHRAALALILEQRSSLGADLSLIRFDPDGNLSLLSSRLGLVRLGSPDSRLARQLQVLQQLSRELPARLAYQPLQSLDLSDPEQPELGLVVSRRGRGAPEGSTGGDRAPGSPPVPRPTGASTPGQAPPRVAPAAGDSPDATRAEPPAGQAAGQPSGQQVAQPLGRD